MIVEHTDVAGALRRLGLPIAGAMLGDQVLGIVDTIAIGSLGTAELAAATAATTAFLTVGISSFGLMSGLGVLGAQAVGAGEMERFGRIVRASSIAPLAVAIACAVLGAFAAHALILALIGPLPTAGAGAAYFALRCASLIPMVATGLAVSALGAAGNTRFAFTVLVAINTIHIPLLLVLALGWGTHHPLGLAGAGISSLTAEIAGAALSVRALLRRPELRVFARFEIGRSLAWQTFALSLPQAVYLLLVLVPDVAIVAFLAALGAEHVAAYRALALVSDVTLAVPIGLETAAQTVLGQRFGAGDGIGARRFQLAATRYGIGLSAAAGIVVACAAWPLAAVVTWNPGLADIAAIPLAVNMLTLPLKGYAFVGLAPIRAVGDTRFQLIVGVVSSVAVIPLAWAGVGILHLGLFAAPFAWIGGWLLWCALVYARLYRFDWYAARL